MDLSGSDTKEFFDKQGFALFPGVFSIEEIARLRARLSELFEVPSQHGDDWDDGDFIRAIRFDLFNRNPDLAWVGVQPKVLDALRGILGPELAMVPESTAHYRGFGTWHKDTTSQERTGLSFHYGPEYCMVECAVYLQDNDPDYGGGLDVVPGSHRMDYDPFLSKPSRLRRIRGRLGGSADTAQAEASAQAVSIPSKAGDFVFFNKRLIHRSTPCRESDVPPHLEKYAVFFVAGPVSRLCDLQDYTAFIQSRADYGYLADYCLEPAFKEQCAQAGVLLIQPVKLGSSS